MRKILGILAALVMVLAMLSITPAANATGTICNARATTTDTKTTMMDSVTGNYTHVYSHYIVGSDACRSPAGIRYARVKWMRIYENVSGSSVHCWNGHIWDYGYNKSTYDMYAWDNHSGRNFHKTATIKCTKDTLGTVFVEFSSSTTPVLYYDTDNGPPKFRFNVASDWRSGYDGHASSKVKELPVV